MYSTVLNHVGARRMAGSAALLLLVGALSAPSASAAPRAGSGRAALNPTASLDLLVERLDLLERRVTNLQDLIQGAPMSRSPSEVSDLLFEANFAFLTEDFERAALLYYTLLDNGDLDVHPDKSAAEFYLAESLFNGRNYRPAQTAYQSIVTIGPVHPHYDEAVTKLIELFGLTGDVEQFNYYYNNFLQTTQSTGASSLRVRYALGKTLYRQGKLEDAKRMFADFPRGSTYTAQARYHYGEILVKEGYAAAVAGDTTSAETLYRAALPVFQDVVSLPTSTDDHVRVLHLAYLATGTLYYELGDLTAAIEAYQQVPQDSVYFSDALFQICWAYIRLSDYERAYRTIDLFLLAFPEDTREPELRLLSAHLQVKLERFEEAVDNYLVVVDEYDAIKARLDHIVGADIDPMVYFNQLVDESYIPDSEYQVPDLAARVARQDMRLANAVVVASDLQREERQIADGQEMVSRLEEAIVYEREGQMMTTYRARRQELDGMDARILAMESDLVFIEANYLIDALGGERAGGVQAIAEQRTRLGQEVTEVSSLYADREEYRDDLESAARALDTESYKLETMIDDALARLAGIELYLKHELATGAMTDDEVQGYRLELEGVRIQLREQHAELADVHARLDPRKLLAGLEDESSDDELDQRRHVRGEIADLVEELVSYRGSVSRSSAADFFAQVDEGRTRLRRMRTDCHSLLGDLDRRERDEVDQIRLLLDQEKSALLAYALEAEGFQRDSQSVSGEIAETSFRTVQELFADTVMQADMGAIDVYWRQKEEITQEKNAIRDEWNKTLKELKRMYESLLQFEDEDEEDDSEGGVIIE